MKEQTRQQFRWAPHTSGVTQIKPKDFELAGEVTAANHYEAWTNLRGSEEALQVGDALESEDGELRIYKYVGFEQARWILPEVKPATVPGAAAAVPETNQAAGVQD